MIVFCPSKVKSNVYLKVPKHKYNKKCDLEKKIYLIVQRMFRTVIKLNCEIQQTRISVCNEYNQHNLFPEIILSAILKSGNSGCKVI